MTLIINILSFGVLIAEIVATIVGLSRRRYLSNSFWSYFPLYLLWVSLLDWTGMIMRYLHLMNVNKFIYNYLVSPSEFLFFCWLLGKMIYNKGYYRNFSIIFSSIYAVIWVIDIVYLSKLDYGFSSFSYTVGNIFLIILILIYLFFILVYDSVIEFTKTIDFWVIIGITTYYLLSFPYYGTYNTLLYKYKNIFEPYQAIVAFLSITMYIFFTVGFLSLKPEKSKFNQT